MEGRFTATLPIPVNQEGLDGYYQSTFSYNGQGPFNGQQTVRRYIPIEHEEPVNGDPLTDYEEPTIEKAVESDVFFANLGVSHFPFTEKEIRRRWQIRHALESLKTQGIFENLDTFLQFVINFGKEFLLRDIYKAEESIILPS